MSTFRVLSESPLNAEPPLQDLASSYVTPTSRVFHRNHGEIPIKNTATFSLHIFSELPDVELEQKLSYADLTTLESCDVVTAISCAGNRRNEIDEKQVEGLLWGGSAIANSKFTGPLLREVLKSHGITLEKLQALGRDVHIHFETSQQCEDAEFYGSSLPLSLALDPDRPVLLATRMNGEPLSEKHGFPCRVVVPGIIGARSVKWLERIIIRDRPSDNFYMTRDYKILPPEATPATKEEYLKQIEPMMELPLNCEICDPEDGGFVTLDAAGSPFEVRGYALGAQGTPIASVEVVLIPLPVTDALDDLNPQSELHRIRLFADRVPHSQWKAASLIDSNQGEVIRHGKKWGWTLFSVEVELSKGLLQQGSRIALIARATDVNGQMQQLQTPWNLRGVGEASWSVSRVTIEQS